MHAGHVGRVDPGQVLGVLRVADVDNLDAVVGVRFQADKQQAVGHLDVLSRGARVGTAHCPLQNLLRVLRIRNVNEVHLVVAKLPNVGDVAVGPDVTIGARALVPVADFGYLFAALAISGPFGRTIATVSLRPTPNSARR